jgi:hypothetical protein
MSSSRRKSNGGRIELFVWCYGVVLIHQKLRCELSFWSMLHAMPYLPKKKRQLGFFFVELMAKSNIGDQIR